MSLETTEVRVALAFADRDACLDVEADCVAGNRRMAAGVRTRTVDEDAHLVPRPIADAGKVGPEKVSRDRVVVGLDINAGSLKLAMSRPTTSLLGNWSHLFRYDAV